MRRNTWATVVFGLAMVVITFGQVGVLTGQAQLPPGQCRIGTFNLEMTHKGGSGTLELKTRLEKIATIIVANDLQVVALQEINADRMKELQEDLNYLSSHNWKYLLIPQTVTDCVAVFFQSDRVRIVPSEPCTLDLHQDDPRQRDAFLIKGQVQPNGFDFTLVIVHLKEGKDKTDAKWREEQLGLLHKWIFDQLESGAEQDIIITGDFNTPLLMNQEDFEILDGGMGFYIVQQDAGSDLYSAHCDATYGNPVDFLIISPDCRAEYIDNTASFESYTSNDQKKSLSDHRLTWATFSNDDFDDPNSTPLVVSNSALVLEMPESIQRGKQVTVIATTRFAGADCTIRIVYQSLSDAQIVRKVYREGNKHKFEWTWKVGNGTSPGIAIIQVQATWKWGHALAIGTFMIPKKPSPGESQDSS